mgnify:FL=1|jgi:hypothetical protein
MTSDNSSEHAPLSSSAHHTRTAAMPDHRAWNMDEVTRNRLLKKYKTQVASGASTICATLAVVSALFRGLLLGLLIAYLPL